MNINMRKITFLLFLFCVALESFGQIISYTIKVGERKYISDNAIGESANSIITGDAAAIQVDTYGSGLSTGKLYVTGLKSGFTTFWNLYNQGKTYVFHVVDVVEIDIPGNVDITVGENYTYTPIVTDTEAETTLTWASGNSSVVTVNSSGMITAVSPGQTTIICTASNGVKAQSVVTVSPMLLSDIALDKQTHEMNVGDNVQLTTTYSPANATTKAVKWMSGNDNVAQVDNDGNVTAIASGYCSIYAIASDGSGKFDKCLIHVAGTDNVKGDINGDGGVTPQDASMILQYVAKKITW